MKRRTLIQAAPLAVVAASITGGAATSSAEERFQHHLGEMLLALAEMPWADNQRWFLAAAGKAGKGRLMELTRFDKIPDPEIQGLMIDKRTEIIGI